LFKHHIYKKYILKMKKIIFLSYTIYIVLFSSACVSKKPLEVTDQYKEEIAVEQPVVKPEEAATIKKGDKPESAATIPLDNSMIHEADGDVIGTPAEPAKKTMSAEDREKMKQKMREKMAAQKKGGGK
jgi:hypothetical protein